MSAALVSPEASLFSFTEAILFIWVFLRVCTAPGVSVCVRFSSFIRTAVRLGPKLMTSFNLATSLKSFIYCRWNILGTSTCEFVRTQFSPFAVGSANCKQLARRKAGGPGESSSLGRGAKEIGFPKPRLECQAGEADPLATRRYEADKLSESREESLRPGNQASPGLGPGASAKWSQQCGHRRWITVVSVASRRKTEAWMIKIKEANGEGQVEDTELLGWERIIVPEETK